MMISQSAGPTIAKKKYTDQEGYERSIKFLFFLMWWTMLPLGVLIHAFSGLLIDLLYGGEYAVSASVLSVHVYAGVFVGLGGMQSIWIVNEKKSGLQLVKTLVGAICNVLLNYVLIREMGVVGAAYATVFSYMISAVLVNLFLAPEIFVWQVASIFNKKF